MICGFTIIDEDSRTIVLEGLAGPRNGLETIFQRLGRTGPNSQAYRVLENPQVRFANRLYTAFDADLKKVLYKGWNLTAAAVASKARRSPQSLTDVSADFVSSRSTRPPYSCLTKNMRNCLGRVDRTDRDNLTVICSSGVSARGWAGDRFSSQYAIVTACPSQSRLVDTITS